MCVCLAGHSVALTKGLPRPSSGVGDLGLGAVGMQSMTFSPKSSDARCWAECQRNHGPCHQGVDGLVGTTGTGQVCAHVIIATEGGRQDPLGAEGDGGVRGARGSGAWSPSSLCQPAVLFTIKCDLGRII